MIFKRNPYMLLPTYTFCKLYYAILLTLHGFTSDTINAYITISSFLENYIRPTR